MIYLKQSFRIHPATPATRDRFVEAAGEAAVPATQKLGARLMAAWFCHEEWFSEIQHVTEFENLAGFGAWREAAGAEGPDAFFEPLRPVALRERMQRLHPLPYSPLQ